MTRKEELVNAIYDLAQNMHDMYELRADVWSDLEEALEALWKQSHQMGYQQGYHQRIEDSRDIINGGGRI